MIKSVFYLIFSDKMLSRVFIVCLSVVCHIFSSFQGEMGVYVVIITRLSTDLTLDSSENKHDSVPLSQI